MVQPGKLGMACLAACLALIMSNAVLGQDIPPYDGKTAAQWIEQLLQHEDEEQRVRAAECLGFMARGGTQTYGGFDYVPIDSVKPLDLTKEDIRPIVTALNLSLSHDNWRVRASSAIAISWIGPRAQDTVPGIIKLLDDDERKVRLNAIRAAYALGPAAREAIPALLNRLFEEEDTVLKAWTGGALREVGADPHSFLPELISMLSYESHAYLAAGEIVELGDAAVPLLLRELNSDNAQVRGYAAWTLGTIGDELNITRDADEVAAALIDLTRDEELEVVKNAVMALGGVRAAPELSVPVLAEFLRHEDTDLVGIAAEALGKFGSQAQGAIVALCGVLARERPPKVVNGNDYDGFARWQSAYSIDQIGLTREGAERLRKLSVEEQEGVWLLVPLFEFPDAALEFLKRNPFVIKTPDEFALIEMLRRTDPESQALRDELAASELLPVTVIARLCDPRYLPMINRRRAAADVYEQIRWAACARACGAPADRVVNISQSEPGDFKPASAMPGHDPSRRVDDSRFHGDGYTRIIITGAILQADGKPADAAKFVIVREDAEREEDRRIELPLNYDPTTGRFVFVTSVFAAYDMKSAKRAPGPYQTSSDRVQVEAVGCKPLPVQFYDEMPDVRITLSADDDG